MRQVAGICVVLAVVGLGCDSGSAPTESAAHAVSGPAGEVVALSGTATATRAEQTRELSVGAEVFADDEIETADGAQLEIALSHNNARWALSGGQKRRVDRSAAWRAEKQSGEAIASAYENRTAAAGRHTEREAAETGPGGPPGDRADEASPDKAAVAADPPAKDTTASKPPPDQPVRPDKDRTSKKKRKGGKGGLGVSGAGRGGGGTGEGTIGIGSVGTIGQGGGSGKGSGYGRGAGGIADKKQQPKIRLGSAKVQGSLSADVIRRILRRNLSRIRYCYEKQLVQDPDLAGKLTLTFSIGESGAVTDASASGVDEKVEACAAKALRTLKFPAPEGGGTVKVTYPVVLTNSE